MKVLFAAAIILAIIAAVGVVALIWSIVWMAIEDTSLGDAIIWRIKYGRTKRDE